MKAAAHQGQRLQIHGILVPLRETGLNRCDLFLGFLDEQLDELRIDRFRLRNRNQRLRRRLGAFGALERNGFDRIELERLCRLAARDPYVGNPRRGLVCQRLDAQFGVIQHVPRIVAAALQRLHVVLDADDGIRHPLQTYCFGRWHAWLDQHPHLRADRVHQFDRPTLAQHQQPRRYAPQQLRNVVEALRRKITGFLYGYGYGLFDSRHIDDAFPQHRLAHQLELEILIARYGDGRPIRCRGQNEANQLIVEAVFDRQENAGHLEQRILVRRLAVGDDLGQLGNLVLDALPQLTESQHAESVADFLEQFELRGELFASAAASAHEYIEDILDLGQIFLDGSGNRAHQFHARRRQALTLVF